jgi:NADP-dependent aldehyde dehydrogenase
MSKTFTAQNPATAQPVGDPIAEWDLIQTSSAIKAADSVKEKLSATNPTQRSALLNAIADAIEEQKEKLAQTANLETALPM